MRTERGLRSPVSAHLASLNSEGVGLFRTCYATGMNAPLDPNDQKELEAIAAAEGRDAEDVLRELVHDALVERKRHRSSASDREPVDRRQQLAAQGVLRLGTQQFPDSLKSPPPGDPPSGVLRELLKERAEGR